MRARKKDGSIACERVQAKCNEAVCAKSGRALSPKTALTIVAVACAMTAVLALGACAPASNQKSEGQGGESQAQEEVAEFTTVAAKDFTENDAGDFTDTWYNREILNAGNRGCNSCHTSMYDTIKNLTASSDPETYPHVIGQPGYGKDYTYRDCTACHFGVDMVGTGPRLEDSIHTIHFSSKEFKENATCESCHAYNSTGDLVLWDDLKYEAELGGFPNADKGTVDGVLAGRQVQNGSLADIVWESDFQLSDVALDQPLSTNEDGSEYTFTAANLGVQKYDAESYTVSVSGVKGKSSWTLDEIEALPATDKLFTQDCGGNINNGPLISTTKATGVLLSDFIDACGGLADGAQALSVGCLDGWISFGMTWDVAALIDQGALIAWQYNDHGLTPEQGYPLVLVVPGFGGNCMPKYIESMNFVDTPGMTSSWTEGYVSTGNQNSGWLAPAEDGEEFKVGEPVTLRGWAYEHSSGGHAVDQIAISADYGNNWTYIDVSDDYDADMWVTFEGTWVPQTAGTYVLKLKVIDNLDPEASSGMSSVIVKVTE